MTANYQQVNPFADAPANVDVESYLASQGWEEFLGIGGENSELYIQSWRRTLPDAQTEYIVDVWNAAFGSPYIKVTSFVDLMDLLARWAPAIQAAAVVAILDEVQQLGLSPSGMIERIAAKAAFGATEGLPILQRQEAEQRAMRRQAREARRRATEEVEA
jgi:hypothetical protein